MDFALIVGWAATVVGAVLGIPQAYRILKTRDVEGVSLRAWQIVLAVNIAWGQHGLKINALNMVVVNALGLASTVTVVVLFARVKHLNLVATLLPGLVLAALLTMADWLWGSALFGMLAAIPALWGLISQGVELVQAPSVEGVSSFYLVGTVVNFALWATWGGLAGDPGTLVASSLSLLAALFNVGWLTFRLLQREPVLVEAGR